MIGARSRRSNFSKPPTRQRTSRGNPSACLSISLPTRQRTPRNLGMVYPSVSKLPTRQRTTCPCPSCPSGLCCLLGSEHKPTRCGASLIFCCLLGSELDGRLAKARRHFLLPTRQRTGGRRPTSTLPFLSCLLGSEQPTASSQSATDFCCLLGSEPTCVAAAATTTFLSCLLGSERAHKEHSRPELSAAYSAANSRWPRSFPELSLSCLLGSELELRSRGSFPSSAAYSAANCAQINTTI